MLPVINVGPLALQIPGLVILVGLWVGISISERYASLRGLTAQNIYNLSFIGLVSGVLGARLSYVLRYPQAFLANPLGVLSLNPGLLDPWGGAACALVAMLIYGQRKQLPLWNTLDALAPGLAAFLAAFHLANFFSGDAYGSITQPPWGIDLWGAVRHPVQLYEMLAALLILAVIWPTQRFIRSASPGIQFFLFTSLTAGARLFFEAFHGDSALAFLGLRQVQLIAWLVLAASLFAFYRLSGSVRVHMEKG
jgi:phosphatidylglycerol:prolipoprotein diacylglycerol transferase